MMDVVVLGFAFGFCARDRLRPRLRTAFRGMGHDLWLFTRRGRRCWLALLLALRAAAA
jgi:hypothetical protein